MDAEMFPVFNGLKGMAAVWALKFERRKNLFSVYKGLSADLALKLSAAAGVVIDVFIWSTAERTYGICRYGMLLAFLGFHRLEGFSIAETIILVPEFPVLLDERFDDRQLVCKELLILRAVDLIMSPLLERDISADKENKPADLAILFLNDSK
jgi:hypothetical protein